MNVVKIKKMAKDLGVKKLNRKKLDLIRDIQIAEGNPDCFGRSSGYCDRHDCLFRDDCLGKAAGN